jgi:cyclopropane fatty-acyl-phospholipid synthase-like methyltransferase
MTVLDVGSGLGGPARQVARTTGVTVIGVEIAPA